MRDINAQPTLFRRDFYRTWQSPPHDFSLDLFAYHQALVAGLEVQRFPVRFGERAHGVSHWNVNWMAKWKFIRRTVAYSPGTETDSEIVVKLVVHRRNTVAELAATPREYVCRDRPAHRRRRPGAAPRPFCGRG